MNDFWYMMKFLNLLDYIKMNETEYKEEDSNTCEIIDIANKEMETIDSSEIDAEFKKVFTGQTTQTLIDSIADNNCTRKDIDFYLKTLKDKDILDLRVSDKYLFIKTKKDIIPLVLAQMMEIEEKCIQEIPIKGKYNFYFIDCSKYASPRAQSDFPLYDPDDLVDILKDIGEDCVEEDSILNEQLTNIINRAFEENWGIERGPIDFKIKSEVEDKVVAIAIDKFIFPAKKIFSEVLFLNPDILTEVSTPLGTVILIDTRRWCLEKDFGDEKWYL